MYEMLEPEHGIGRLWLIVGVYAPLGLGVSLGVIGLGLSQTHRGDLGDVLLSIPLIIVGVVAMVATGFGAYWRGISTGRKVAALPGLIVGCTIGFVLLAVLMAAKEAFKAEFGGRG